MTMRKLTLLLDDDIYEGLHRVAGRGHIGSFVSEKVRPYLVSPKQGRLEAVAGCLAHRARPGAQQDLDRAKVEYMRQRWSAKPGGAGAK